MKRSQFRSQKGLSVVEFVIVVLIIGILAATAAPKYIDLLSRHSVESAAKRVAMDLKLVISRARTTSTSQTIDFSVPDNSYEIPGLPDLAYRDSDYYVQLSGEPYRSTLYSAEFADDAPQLTVNGFGKPDASGLVVLRCGRYEQHVSVTENGSVIVLPGPKLINEVPIHDTL